MFFQFFSWVLLLVYLLPLIIAGIVILRKTSLIDRFEILLPAGSIFGITLFTFFINLFSFVEAGRPAIFMAFIFLILLGIFVYKAKVKTSTVSYPSGKILLFFITSILIWTTLIFWKGNNALIGSDTNLYYAIAHTFLKGNFPPLTPWQPDLPLSYHLGASQLLAAFYLFTNLSFAFLHIFLSCFFILACSQLIVWIWKRHSSLLSFIWGNIFAAIILISVGFLKLIIPYSFELPQINSLQQLFFWIRDLPTVNQSIEVYGAAINLDALIYFIFHSFGLTLALALIVLSLHQRSDKSYLTWGVLVVGLASLALINESIFVFLASAVIITQLISAIISKNLKEIIVITLASATLALIVLFQGGVITNTIFPKTNLEKSVLFFPSKADSKEDFAKYHYYQEISKTLPVKNEWLPFRWFSMGTDLLILVPSVLLLFIKPQREKLLVLTFFLSGLFALLAYNFIVPKFLVANGNRLLGFAFIFLSLATLLSFQFVVNRFKNPAKNLLLGAIMIFIIIPTILPPLTLLSKNRFPEKKLIPHLEQKTEGIKWMESNLPFNKRVMVLDIRTPHPSGQSRAMVQSGVFAPIFPGDFKAYTIEATPEYFDIAFLLSPNTLKALKISTLLIDSHYYETLPDVRKKQLNDEKYFRKVFEHSKDQTWERVYMVDDKYFQGGGETDGTFFQLRAILPTSGKIYIDNEENFDPSYLRRAIIFSLRNQDIYYLPQSGVYLNVETNVNSHPPLENGNYDYLILGKNTDPKNVCKYNTKLIWKGFNNEVYVWKKLGIL